MIRSICCVCGKQYGTKDDGLPGVLDSHGYCERHYDEIMAQIRAQYAELSGDGHQEAA